MASAVPLPPLQTFSLTHTTPCAASFRERPHRSRWLRIGLSCRASRVERRTQREWCRESERAGAQQRESKQSQLVLPRAKTTTPGTTASDLGSRRLGLEQMISTIGNSGIGSRSASARTASRRSRAPFFLSRSIESGLKPSTPLSSPRARLVFLLSSSLLQGLPLVPKIVGIACCRC